MKITIVYDNELFTKGNNLQSGWGFACIIESNEDTILFDTGEKGEILLNNLKILNIGPLSINKIVISHEHSDHKGGLKTLISHIKEVELYQLSDDSFQNNIKTCFPKEPQKINENIWTTGRIRGTMDEQSLILKGETGWFVLTGCSHPGVDKILEKSGRIGRIKGLIGGFHDFNNFNVVENLNIICPCHCTSHKNELKNKFPEKIIEGGVGKIIEI